VAIAADHLADSSLARATLAWPVFRLPWVVLGGLVALGLVGVTVPREWRYLPLLASVVAFGLPHGAIDYVALPRVVAGEVTLRLVALVSLVYAVLGAGYAATWFLAPVPAAGLFIAVTWFHWGQGELYPLAGLLGADYLDRPQRVATALVRGGLPMLVPLLGFPDRYRAVVDSFVTPFGSAFDTAVVFAPDVRLALGVTFAALTALTLARGYYLTTDTTTWAVDAGETLLLWVYFLVVPPVLAVGVYFCLWHAVRHIARAIGVDERASTGLRAGRLWPSLVRFAREALPLTAVALLLLGVLWLAVPGPVASLSAATGLYLAFIAVLTLPHVVVVLWMDHAQGIWTRG
jgi:Brp/Blh family beta-carotene 15,15'-monooxygenase